MKDLEEAWNDIQREVHDARSSLETFVAKERLREGVEIQDFQIEQMSRKREESLKIYEEFNVENERIARMRQEDEAKEVESQREIMRKKKIVDVSLRVNFGNFKEKIEFLIFTFFMCLSRRKLRIMSS